MSKFGKLGNSVAWIAVIALLFSFGYLVNQTTFPAFEYVDSSLDRQLLPLSEFDNIANQAARFLWDNRVLDLIGQAFVIVAAVVCCLAMLKQAEGGH